MPAASGPPTSSPGGASAVGDLATHPAYEATATPDAGTDSAFTISSRPIRSTIPTTSALPITMSSTDASSPKAAAKDRGARLAPSMLAEGAP